VLVTEDLKSNQENKTKVGFRNKRKYNDWMWAYIMIAPLMAGIIYFYFIAFFQNFFFSFTDLNAFGKWSFIGITNYVKILKDPTVWQAFKNTAFFTIVSVPISICLSIFVAYLLNSKIKGRTIYRTLFFLPVVTMPAAVAMVWRWLYIGDYGIINYFLKMLSIKGPYWLNDPRYAIFTVITVAIWSSIGYNMVIFLAGMQGISSTYYEAAAIDGANSFAKFFKITLPLLTPSIFFVSIISLIRSFQVFDLILMMITEQSVALEQTQSIVYLFYKIAFVFGNRGYASAISIILFFVILIVTIVQTKYQGKWVTYDV
jgi:multiple sugar transport system permease protein